MFNMNQTKKQKFTNTENAWHSMTLLTWVYKKKSVLWESRDPNKQMQCMNFDFTYMWKAQFKKRFFDTWEYLNMA